MCFLNFHVLESPGDLVKKQILVLKVWIRVAKSSFLTSSQMAFVLEFRKPHFE